MNKYFADGDISDLARKATFNRKGKTDPKKYSSKLMFALSLHHIQENYFLRKCLMNIGSNVSDSNYKVHIFDIISK